MSNPTNQPSRSGKYLDTQTWEALKASGYTDEQLYEDQPFGPIISAYSRKQALEDGVLVDLTRPGFARLLKLVGIKIHTAMTAAAFAQAVTPTLDQDHAEQAIGRMVVVLAAFRKAVGLKMDTDRVTFHVFDQSGKRVNLWALIGPGDEGEPVLTIMLESED